MAKALERPVFHAALGAYFQGLREARRLPSLRVAARVAEEQQLAISFGELQRLEAGRTLNPDPALLRDLATLYRRPYEELVSKLVEVRFGVAVPSVVEVSDPRMAALEDEVVSLRQRLAAVSDAARRLVEATEPSTADASPRTTRPRRRRVPIDPLLADVDDRAYGTVLAVAKRVAQGARRQRSGS